MKTLDNIDKYLTEGNPTVKRVGIEIKRLLTEAEKNIVQVKSKLERINNEIGGTDMFDDTFKDINQCLKFITKIYSDSMTGIKELTSN